MRTLRLLCLLAVALWPAPPVAAQIFNPPGSTPTSNPQLTMRWYGVWASPTAYPVGAMVFYAGSSYLALAPNTGVIPGLDNTWALVANGAPTNGVDGQLPTLGAGILKHANASPTLTLAGSPDVISLFTGTCNSGSLLAGDGTCAVVLQSFNIITAGTNPNALVMGSGGSLDVSGTGSINATKVNGTPVPVNSAADQVLLTTASATGSWAAVPACLDAGGNHLNYNATTHVFSCGTSGTGGVTSVFGRAGAVAAATGDYAVGQITGAAPSASPTFTGTVDASGAAHTFSAKVGPFSSIPATCGVGEQFFASDAAAGVNKYYCTATNTWTQGGVNAANITVGALNSARTIAGFTGCSGAYYLGADGACHQAGQAPFSQAITAVSSQAITHNLGTSQPWVTCYDGSGNLLGGATATTSITNVVANSANLATVTFSGVTTGVCKVSSGSMGPVGSTGATGAAGTNGAIAQVQVSGVNATVRPNLNLIPGLNSTVTCVDNSGATSTDCTIASTASTGPTTTKPGSIIPFLNGSASAGGKMPGAGIGGGDTACTHPAYWPLAGYVRNAALSTTNANGSNVNARGNISLDCYGTAAAPGGAVIAPSAAAGGFVDAGNGVYGHLIAGGMLAFYTNKQFSSGTMATVWEDTVEFVSDDNNTSTVLPGSVNAAGPALSTTTYYGFYGGSSTTELNVAFPMPVAGNITSIVACTNGAPAATGTWTLNKNGVATALAISQLSTDSGAGCKVATGTVAIAAGDYIDFADAVGITTSAVPTNYYAVFTPTNGTSSVFGGIGNSLINQTTYYPFGSFTNASTTEQSTTVAMPMPCTATNLRVVLQTAEVSASTMTAMLRKNLADTVVTGTLNAASGTGNLLVYSGAGAAFAKGDQMDLKLSFTGTANNAYGFSISCN